MGTILSPATGANVYKGAIIPVSYRSDTVDFGCTGSTLICVITYKLNGTTVANLIPISQSGTAPQTQANQNITMPTTGATAVVDIEGWSAGGQLNDTATATYNLVDAPSITCDPATLITATGAQINATIAGTLLAGGSARFVYGAPTPNTNAATTYAAGAVNAAITGLTAGTTYTYRLEILDALGAVITTGPDCTFTTSAATGATMALEAQLVKLCSITGSVLMKDCTTNDPILLIEVTASDGDVVPTTSTEFPAAATGAGVFSTIGFYRSYYADLNGAYLNPQPATPCMNFSGNDSEFVILCDTNAGTTTRFLRRFTVDAVGAVGYTDTDWDGVTGYTPAGVVSTCNTSDVELVGPVCEKTAAGATVATLWRKLVYDGTTQVYAGFAGYTAAAPQTWVDPYTPGAANTLAACVADDLEAVDFCLRANTAGTGYAIGDQIKLTRWFNPTTNTQVSEVAFNMTAGGAAVTVPLTAANFDECPSGGVDTETLTLCDVAANGAITQFIRHLTYSTDGTTATGRNTALDGTTAYTPAGTVVNCAQTAAVADSRHAEVVGAAAAVTQAVAALIPVGKTLVSFAYSILTGTANVTDAGGTVLANLPTGFNAAWSADGAGKLNPPTSITANANSRVVVVLTVR